MGKTVLKTVQGKIPADLPSTPYKDTLLTSGPIIAFLVLVLFLGIFIPDQLSTMINDAIHYLEYPL
jgi:hypothetical protein